MRISIKSLIILFLTILILYFISQYMLKNYKTINENFKPSSISDLNSRFLRRTKALNVRKPVSVHNIEDVQEIDEDTVTYIDNQGD